MLKKTLFLASLFCIQTFSTNALAIEHNLNALSPVNWVNNIDGNKSINLFFFFSNGCPHCRDAKPFVDKLIHKYPWIHVIAGNVNKNESLPLWKSMTTTTNAQFGPIPFFAYCGQQTLGFDSEDTTGKMIEDSLLSCHNKLIKNLS